MASSCGDFLQFRHSKVVKNSFVSVSLFFFYVNSSRYTFYEAFTCLIRNNLTNIFKTTRHVEKKNHKDNKFPVTSSKIDHGQRPITAPVPFRFIISFFNFYHLYHFLIFFDQNFLERVYGLPPNLQI